MWVKNLNLRWIIYILIFGTWSLWLVYQRVGSFDRYIVDNCLTDLQGTSSAELVLGAGVDNDQVSQIFADRLDTAVELYRAGKAKKIIVSGDNGNVNYDETDAGKEYLLSKKIPAVDIFLDYAGFDTFDSLYRAKNIYGADKILVVTQDFHLPRSLYIAHRLGLNALGCRADKRFYINSQYLRRREYLASIKAWLDINLGSKPKFSGEKFDLTGDGQKTWDNQ